jgi:hypothetical protein
MSAEKEREPMELTAILNEIEERANTTLDLSEDLLREVTIQLQDQCIQINPARVYPILRTAFAKLVNNDNAALVKALRRAMRYLPPAAERYIAAILNRRATPVSASPEPDKAVLEHQEAQPESGAGVPQMELIEKLRREGVFKGFAGLEGLAEADAFWEQQTYGTRLYYGDGIADYLHRSVLKAAICALNRPPPFVPEQPKSESGTSVSSPKSLSVAAQASVEGERFAKAVYAHGYETRRTTGRWGFPTEAQLSVMFEEHSLRVAQAVANTSLEELRDASEPRDVKVPEMELPAVVGDRIDCSIATFERRALVALAHEQAKLAPDNALIALYCDAVRLGREYCNAMNLAPSDELQPKSSDAASVSSPESSSSPASGVVQEEKK